MLKRPRRFWRLSHRSTARRALRGGGLLLAAMMLVGCGGYRMQGLVVEGKTPAVLLVDKNDSRLQQEGLSGAVLEVTVDPRRMTPKPLAPVASDNQGRFEVPVSEPGAGLLEYEVLVLCRMAGYQSVTQNMPLPSGDKRLLIVLVPGRDTYTPKPDILRETLQMKDQLESK